MEYTQDFYKGTVNYKTKHKHVAKNIKNGDVIHLRKSLIPRTGVYKGIQLFSIAESLTGIIGVTDLLDITESSSDEYAKHNKTK